jgi:hypothetical protein
MRLRVFAIALAAALLSCGTAFADTLTVTSQEDEGPGTLAQTILDAGAGDEIRIPPGTYLLANGNTLIDQQNILRGAGVERTTVIPSGGGDALDQISYSGLTVGPAKQTTDDGGSQIETQAQIIALIATLAIFLLILELVRRRRLVERYALLWMAAAVVLLVLAIWSDGLDVIADAMGIKEPANAIFILAFGMVFLLLLNFSVATSRLSEETKILAQETARLEQELRVSRGEIPTTNGDSAAALADAEQAADERPVGAEDET